MVRFFCLLGHWLAKLPRAICMGLTVLGCISSPFLPCEPGTNCKVPVCAIGQGFPSLTVLVRLPGSHPGTETSGDSGEGKLGSPVSTPQPLLS